jgi:Bifunctional DNA primase/polymerase, N-terminal
VSRPRWRLRDAALGYAARGIPVLPLHYPLPHPSGLQPVRGNRHPVMGSSCSCRDPGCGQSAKHPLGSLVSHGVKDATTNRARIMAWWTRHPQANIGLATGHRFDVLDVDGPASAQAIRTLAATHGLQSFGPLVRTGGVAGTTAWPSPASATPVRPGWSMWTGAAGAGMRSRHPAATPPATPTNGPPAAISRPR